MWFIYSSVDIFNLNLQIDECGTQQPIALLKSIFDKQGMYERRKCFNWKELVDVCTYKIHTMNRFISSIYITLGEFPTGFQVFSQL